MGTSVVGKDEGNGEGGKSKGNVAKRVIAKKMAMMSNDNNEVTATETTAQHCCPHHHYPCLGHCGSSLCFGALAAAAVTGSKGVRTKGGAWGGGGVVCGDLVHSKTRYLCFCILRLWLGSSNFPPKVRIFMFFLFG
jgi:hypothetical protein